MGLRVWPWALLMAVGCSPPTAPLGPPDAAPPDGADAGDPARPARLRAEPAVLQLGAVALGSVAPWSVDVVNEGSRAIDLDRVLLEPEDTPGASITATPRGAAEIEPGARFTLDGTLAPSARGPIEAVLTVRHPTGVLPTTVTVRAQGVWDPAVLLDPEDVGFGVVELGARAEVEVVLTPTDAPRSLTTEGCDEGICATPRALQIPAGEPGRLRLTFEPSRSGPTAGAVLIRSGDETRRVELRGQGVGSALACRARLINRVHLGGEPLPPIPEGACGIATVVCANLGLGLAVMSEVRTAGTNAVVTTNFVAPGSLAPRETRAIELEVCPSAAGPVRVEVEVEGAAPVPALRIEGVAVGPRFDVVGGLTLGLLPVGMPRQFVRTVVNHGLRPLDLQTIEAVGPDASAARLLSWPARLDPGASGELRFEVRPARTGVAQVGLRFTSNDERADLRTLPLAFEGVSRACQLTLHTPQVDFGARAFGGGRARSYLVMEHTGDAPCAVALTRALAPPFAYHRAPLEELDDGVRLHLELRPGEAAAWPIEATLSGPGLHAAALDLLVATQGAPRQISVPLRAAGGAIGVAVLPRRPPCVPPDAPERAVDLRILPSGATSVRVSHVAFEPFSDAFEAAQLPPVPASATGTTGLGLQLRWRNLTPGAHLGRLRVEYEVGGVARDHDEVVGIASGGTEQVDHFQPVVPPKMDVVWLADGSGSMSDDVTMAPNIQAFASFFTAHGIDLRLFVASVDGAATGPAAPLLLEAADAPLALEADASDFAERWLQRIALAWGGHQLEQPFEAAHAAVAYLRAAGALREEAVLSIVAVTDEDDASPGTVQATVDDFLRIKGSRRTNLFSFSAITGDRNLGCRTDEGSAAPAPRLTQAAERTGGVFQSICGRDWSRSLEFFGTGSGAFRNRHFLTNPPIVETLRVFVAGAPVPATTTDGTVQWAYDLATNSINFSPFGSPPPGADIEVRYYPECL